jgi:hypothetical protein
LKEFFAALSTPEGRPALYFLESNNSSWNATMLNRAAVWLLLAGTLSAQDTPGTTGVDAARDRIDFVRDIQPILRDHCYGCHGAEKKRGALRLDSREWVLRGGVSGKILIPGQAKASPLYLLLVDPDADSRMPQKADPLPKAITDRLRAWIDQGAPWPDAVAGEVAVERHWAYVKPVEPRLPAVKNAAWSRHPIDAVLAAEHEARGLRPRPEAPREVLLRRAFLDLIGLPPTPEEAREFLEDRSPDAWTRLVDRLLADPRYGERWGRHWMDVWRYSDWAGFKEEVRESRPHIWRWRDWIIDSLNADKGYDRMVVEMLAGDELAPDDPDTLRATGFLARNWLKSSRDTWLMTTVEHTSKAFLATTINCARCHNHFFDPISQKEYYQFRAFFEPHQIRTDNVPGVADAAKDGVPRAYDADPAAQTWLYVRGDEKNPDRTHPIVPAAPRVMGGASLKIEPVALPLSAIVPEKREFVVRDLRAAAAQAASDARAALERKALEAGGADAAAARKALDELPLATLEASVAEARRAALDAVLEVERLDDAGSKASPERAAAARAAAAAQRAQAVAEAKRGLVAARLAVARAAAGKDAEPRKKAADAEKSLAEAEKKAQEVTEAFTPRKTETYPSTSSGRRLALARWIASTENPLAARVAVNHVWARHFGRPIVPSVFDFGHHGRPPVNPALLDLLAVRLVKDGWSLKALHRWIMASEAYRMDSSPDAEDLAKDPENLRLWRWNAHRLEAEAVRDSLLHVAGTLDLRRGGPDLDAAQGLTVPRRSLYFRHAAEKMMPFLEMFDAASVVECYERTESIVPQQALALSNSGLSQEVARRVAASLAPVAGDPAAFVDAAYRRVLGRAPSPAEAGECSAFLDRQARLLSEPKALAAFPGSGSSVAPSADPAQRAREDLVHVLLNHHDFVTVR